MSEKKDRAPEVEERIVFRDPLTGLNATDLLWSAFINCGFRFPIGVQFDIEVQQQVKGSEPKEQ